MERREITVQGTVQGVGFRPFVYGLATRLRLAGSVQNRMGSVVIEIEGEHDLVRKFCDELQRLAPPLSRIDKIESRLRRVENQQGFVIKHSGQGPEGKIWISPDVATCQACLAELFDPSDRRYRYPFLNCTHCGPRLTIVQGAPYDRERTTMSAFPMCARCRAEYEDPADRRFHAQPIACPECGPQLVALTADGDQIVTSDPLTAFAGFLDHGRIGAVKGLGGFHLVCKADDEETVSELRRRKHREEKPFAIMVPDVETARQYCDVGPRERSLLESPRRPIVLLRKLLGKTAAARIAEAVAPGNPYLGVMLPYTPLHYLLMKARDGGVPLVMTSGNQSDEPIAYHDEDALDRLGTIADVFLTHDRPIHVRCDDSVTRIVGNAERPIRRSRGFAPEPLKLPTVCAVPILAVGGQLKDVFGLGRDDQAFLSHHIGDLEYYASLSAFERDIHLYEELFDIRPALIVHDLHPEYASTHYASRRAAREGTALLAVQHHHAHLASCLAEHGLNEPAIGVIFDGTGWGLDQAVWGGEFLVGDLRQFTRAAHWRPVRLPGGDQAIRNPWRMAAAHLRDAGCSLSALDHVSCQEQQLVERLIARGFNSPWTTSAGRLFDAVAALAGVRSRVSYEGQAAQELEWLATEAPDAGAYPFTIEEQGERALTWQFPVREKSRRINKQRTFSPALWIDTRPLIRAVVEDVQCGIEKRIIARRFHATIGNMIAAVCDRIRVQTRLETVVFSGGVFQNALLSREAESRLRSAGFRVYQHRLVPPGDGGLSLGQLAIASTYSQEVSKSHHTASPGIPTES